MIPLSNVFASHYNSLISRGAHGRTSGVQICLCYSASESLFE